MFYKLWAKQNGDGCDNTIGCGEKLFDLESETMKGALVEAIGVIESYAHNNHFLVNALLLEVVAELDQECADFKDKFDIDAQNRILQDKINRLEDELKLYK